MDVEPRDIWMLNLVKFPYKSCVPRPWRKRITVLRSEVTWTWRVIGVGGFGGSSNQSRYGNSSAVGYERNVRWAHYVDPNVNSVAAGCPPRAAARQRGVLPWGLWEGQPRCEPSLRAVDGLGKEGRPRNSDWLLPSVPTPRDTTVRDIRGRYSIPSLKCINDWHFAARFVTLTTVP